MYKFFSVSASAIAITVMSSVNVGASEVTNWRYFTYLPTNDSLVHTVRAFAEDIAEATDGRLAIQVFSGGELPYKMADVMRVVATNQIQMGDVAIGGAAGDIPALDVLSLPFLCNSFDQFQTATAVLAPTIDAAILERFKLKVAMHWTMPPQNMWFNRSISSFAELSGMKIRTWNPGQIAMIEYFGGSPVSLNALEVIPALERRVIDGAITSALSANDWRAFEIVKTGFMANVTMAHHLTVVNEDELAKLPEDVRAILLDKLAEWAPRYVATVVEKEEEARANLTANGMSLVEPTEEDREWARGQMQAFWSSWAEANGETARGLLDSASQACAAATD